MKDIIKEILYADELARNKLASVEAERDNLHLDVIEQKKLINEHYMDEAKAKLALHKEQLNEKLEQHQAKLRQQYELVSKEITYQFNSNRDRWITSIYERCIKQ